MLTTSRHTRQDPNVAEARDRIRRHIARASPAQRFNRLESVSVDDFDWNGWATCPGNADISIMQSVCEVDEYAEYDGIRSETSLVLSGLSR
jgi:hypothetical protein